MAVPLQIIFPVSNESVWTCGGTSSDFGNISFWRGEAIVKK